YIADTLARLRFETSTMYPSFVRPILLDQLRAGGSVRFAAAHAAAWAHWLATGNPVEDRHESELVARARSADLAAFVGDPIIFGPAGSDARFLQSYVEFRRLLSGSGITALLRDLAAPSLSGGT
ncbi:MAG: hypothetical protein KIT69_19310, partial [Propionibacteriaceae bacterium]|nr:hypothetical protein [Propionibacteriaceae bacterium]